MACPDGGLIHFDIRTPVADDGLAANVRSCMARGLREALDDVHFRPDPVHIIANGPSARRAPLDGTTVALNRAIRLFTDAGRYPTFWAACDPQAILLEDLGENPPRETVYLVASKCHPSVFDALKDRLVLIWHIDERATREITGTRLGIASGTSITATVFELLARMGFRDFHTWGWDGCKMDGLENAAWQVNTQAPQKIEVDGHLFESTTTWGLEAQSALVRLTGFPFPVHIHGGGMFGAILKALIPNRIVTDDPS